MKIDIEDINYIKAHEALNIPHIKAKYSASIYWVLKYFLTLLWHGTRSILSMFDTKYYKNLEPCKYALFAFTDNNYRSLFPIQEKIEDAVIYRTEELPLQRVCFYALLYSPFVIIKYLRSSGYMKKAYASEFLSFTFTYGYFIEAKKILKRINPFMIIIANDHGALQRSFFRAAQQLGIKTTYVQHASVTENFPPLEFDYAFLDGQESLEKYTANNKFCKSDVILSGSPRFDFIKQTNKTVADAPNLRVGLAINDVDHINKIISLIYKLDANFFKIMIRPHPSMDTSFWKDFAHKYNCSFSDSLLENPFIFVDQNDVFISGESSFHLDVALTGKKSFYCNLTNNMVQDWYGYLKTGLIEDITDNLDLTKKIQTLDVFIDEDRVKLIQYYVANYNTLNWGKAADFIVSSIYAIEKQNSIR